MGGLSVKNLLKDSGLKEVFTEYELIHKRGWSKKLISEYLTPVEKTQKEYELFNNPNIVIYYRDDVYKLESDGLFRNDLYKENEPKRKYKDKSDKIQSLIDNIGVVYVNKSIIEELSNQYVDNYLQNNPECFHLMIEDKNFTNNCMYNVIRDVFTSYKSDMKKLKKYNANIRDTNIYKKQLDETIIKIYPYLKMKG